MADRLNEFVVDRDHAIYSAGVLGIGNNRATFSDNDSLNASSLQWMQDTWFVNGVTNWFNLMYVAPIVAGSGKYGWAYHANLEWIYIVPDIYRIYSIDYWGELFNDFDGFEGSISFLNNNSDRGLWFWSANMNTDPNNYGWVYVNPSSVGFLLDGKGGTETNGLVGLYSGSTTNLDGVIFMESRMVPQPGDEPPKYDIWVKTESFNGNIIYDWRKIIGEK